MTSTETQSAQKRRKRRPRKRGREFVRYKVTVSASAMRISQMGPRLTRLDPDGQCRSTISIEGSLDQPVLRDVRGVYIFVFEGDKNGCDPGGAIGVGTSWQVVLYLPR